MAKEADPNPYVTLPGGATLYYTDEGAGDPLLFVHAWTGDSNDYLWQIAHFRATHRVIAPDLRGHGRSAVLQGGYEARTFARDLVELLDARGVDRCVAIGHSLGGLIVSALAVEYPQRVRGIVCLDPAYGVDAAGVAACHRLIAAMDQPGWRSLLAEEFPTWEHADATPAYFRELHRRRMLAMDPMVVRETFRQIFAGGDPLGPRERTERYFAGRLCPVLGIYAGDDRHERVAWEKSRSRNPADRFEYLPVGHWLQQDAPEAVNRLIAAWLTGLEVSQSD